MAQELNETLRRVASQLVLLSDTVAHCVGLHPTDLQCLDLLRLAGPTTASTLASRVGLTTGAMTAVIDRLERAGLVRRERVREDRRRVLVHVVEARVKPIVRLYQPLGRRVAAVDAGFSNDQLGIILAYLSGILEACAEHVSSLQRLRNSKEHRRRMVRRRATSRGPLKPTAARAATHL